MLIQSYSYEEFIIYIEDIQNRFVILYKTKLGLYKLVQYVSQENHLCQLQETCANATAMISKMERGKGNNEDEYGNYAKGDIMPGENTR